MNSCFCTCGLLTVLGIFRVVDSVRFNKTTTVSTVIFRCIKITVRKCIKRTISDTVTTSSGEAMKDLWVRTPMCLQGHS